MLILNPIPVPQGYAEVEVTALEVEVGDRLVCLMRGGSFTASAGHRGALITARGVDESATMDWFDETLLAVTVILEDGGFARFTVGSTILVQRKVRS